MYQIARTLLLNKMWQDGCLKSLWVRNLMNSWLNRIQI